MFKRLIFFLLIVQCSIPVFGQRVFKTVAPEEEDLRFDINTVPVSAAVREVTPVRGSNVTVDLNFSPNVVFSPDSSKGFVSYSFGDDVMVFSPKTGEILGFVEVGENPVQLTLTPDGKTVGVVSLLLDANAPRSGETLEGDRVGSISLIDIETLQVRTLAFEETVFSFANNIVFSEDSKTGYIGSSRTDELLRFDVETLTEIEPRLAMEPGTRPSALTMAPDFSFLALVLVGSTNLSRTEIPDSIQMIDPVSFEVIGEVVPDTGPGSEIPLLHDFASSNRLAISQDGRYGVIADQQQSAASLISPELGSDRAWLIDFDAQEVVEVFQVGGVAGSSFLAPNGKFIVISAFDFTIIDAENQTGNRITPSRSNFRPLTRPAFSADGRTMYIGAPLDDVVLVVDLQRQAVSHFFPVGGEIDLGGGITLSSAPMDVSLTPDEQVIVALNYNADTIDLISDTERFFIPRILSNDEFFTGVAITNLDDEKAEIITAGRSNQGILFTDLTDTQDIVEFVNPTTLDVDPGTQLALTVDQILEAAGDPDFEGWLVMDSDQFKVGSFFLVGDRASKRLDGGIASLSAALEIVLPEVRTTDGFQTEITVLNPNLNSTTVKLELFDGDGELVESVDRLVLGQSLLTGLVKDPDPSDTASAGLFTDESFEDLEDPYIVASSPEGIVAFERYFDAERLSALNGISLAEAASTESFVPQVVSFRGSQTTLALINTADTTRQLTLSLKDNQGGNQVSPVQLELDAGEAGRFKIAELFNLSDPGQVVTGWVLIETDGPGLAGDAELQLFSGRAMTTIPFQSQPAQSMVFSHVAEGLGLSTGLAFLNPGADAAEITVEVFDREGVLVESFALILPPEGRVSQLLDEFVGGFPQLLGGYIQVTSNQPIIGLELFFADNLELVSAVPAQLVE